MPRQRKKGIKGRGSVFLRKDGRWVAQFMAEEDGKQKQLYAATEAKAWQKLDKALQEQKQGILATGPQQKLGDYLNWWLEEVHSHLLRKSTYLRHRGILNNHILPKLGQVQLRKLTTRQIQMFYNEKLKEKQSPNSIHNMHEVLHGGLRHAVKLRYLSYNPSDGVTLPSKKPLREGQSLTQEQAHHLLNVAHGHRLEAFIALALTTGMRHGELTALRWSDITIGTATELGMVHIHRTADYRGRYKYLEGDPKTKKSERIVPLAPAIYAILERHKQTQNEARRKAGARWKEQDLVFPNTRGSFLHSDTTRGAFYKLLAKANNTPDESGQMIHMPQIHIHDLRHTASTLWESLGISEKMRQELLGHTKWEITRNVYTHVIPAMQKDAAERINKLLD
ncbi:MAG TPA: site-specific integrase [Ktedonobacteraceae bacterium]|nr:site-specific integrase [Ktedonobacteraceae bacterium]